MLKWSQFHFFLCSNNKRAAIIVNSCTISQNSSTKNKKNCVEFDENEVAELKKKTRKRQVGHKIKLDYYFKSNKKRLKLKHLLPDECFIQKKTIEYLYLVDPVIAKRVATFILQYFKYGNSQLVAECTPGLGVISKELLKAGIKSVRLYEPLPKFRDYLKELNNIYPGRVQLFTKNLFKISSYFYLDKIDNGNRIDQLLRGVPKRSWISDPVMTIIGPIVNTYFLRHLARALPMQTSLAAYGRVEMFLMMKPRDYIILTADVPLNLVSLRYMTVFFNLFFDYELIEKLPRDAFLPWEAEKKFVRKQKLRKIDEDKIYLVRVIWKKDLPLPVDQLMLFYYFIKQCFGGRTKIVPTLESWVPGCGENIIWPKQNHDDYFEDMSIHTEFNQLNPNQVLGVFKEMYQHPSFMASPFLGMVEAELMKSETVESNSNVISSDLEKNIIEDIEVNLDDT